MALSVKGQSRRGERPGLRLSARLPQGDTNLRTLKALLPKALGRTGPTGGGGLGLRVGPGLGRSEDLQGSSFFSHTTCVS